MSSAPEIQVLRLDPAATLPTRAHPEDAGLDLYGIEDVCLPPGSGAVLRTGIALEIRPGCVGLVSDRSSLAKKGLKTSGGVIDAGYRGEIRVVIWNLAKDPLELRRGERIAQLLIIPIETPAVREVTELGETKRGEKGFGSTGR